MDSDLASSGRLRFSSGIPSLLFSSGRFSLAIPLAVELFAEYARLTTKRPRTRIRIRKRNSVPPDLSSYVPSKQIPDSLRTFSLHNFTLYLSVCLSHLRKPAACTAPISPSSWFFFKPNHSDCSVLSFCSYIVPLSAAVGPLSEISRPCKTSILARLTNDSNSGKQREFNSKHYPQKVRGEQSKQQPRCCSPRYSMSSNSGLLP